MEEPIPQQSSAEIANEIIELSLSRSGDEDAHIWDQLPNESDKAYAAFMLFVESGPHVRSIEETAKLLGKSPSLLYRWSSEHLWLDRARAWDNYDRRVKYTAKVRAVVEQEERHAQIGQTLQRLALEHLAVMDPENLTTAQAIKCLNIGVQIERVAMGRPTEILDVTYGEARDAEEDYTTEQLMYFAQSVGLFENLSAAGNIIEHLAEQESDEAPS